MSSKKIFIVYLNKILNYFFKLQDNIDSRKIKDNIRTLCNLRKKYKRYFFYIVK